jgi:hypothetical protein
MFAQKHAYFLSQGYMLCLKEQQGALIHDTATQELVAEIDEETDSDANKGMVCVRECLCMYVCMHACMHVHMFNHSSIFIFMF